MVQTTSESKAVSRVQHVKEMRRNASRFRERVTNPPPIVVTEVIGDDVASELSAGLPRSRDNLMYAIPKSRNSVASVRPLPSVPSPNRQRPSVSARYLHPFSAVERHFFSGQSGVIGSPHQRSCPVSPVGRNLSSGGIGPRAPALQLDTRCHNIDYNYVEIAMEVAEEAARICDSPLPIPTDVPLVHSGLCSRTADDLKTWLMLRFNYDGHTDSLLDEHWTPECLARDIIQRSPDFGLTLQHSGMIPISLGSPCMTPVMRVPEEASLSSSPESMSVRSPLPEVPQRRTRMKKDLTITLTSSPVNTRFPHTPSRSFTSPVPPPSSARRVTKASSLDLNTGANEPRSGKKAGFVAGLLAMGALFTGSPSTTKFNRADMTPNNYDTAPHLGVSSSLMDLPHTPYSASGFGGWYGVHRESPSSAAQILSPPELYTTASGEGGYIWFAQSPEERR